MSTTAQVTANRANAQLCTGPKTEAGKTASSQNALRHGLTSARLILAGEDPAEFDALRTQLLEEHQPAGTVEAMLIEEIAQTWWRLQRARRVESDALEETLTNPDADFSRMEKITRYMTTIERAWHKAIAQLTKLQADRKKLELRIRLSAAKETLDEGDQLIGDMLSAPVPSTTSGEIGFVSQKRSPRAAG